jgi:PDZ domain-containing protein
MTRRMAALVPLGALLVAMWAVRLPYYAEGPGPARDVEPLIRIDGATTYPSGGHFILTSVSFRYLNAFGAIHAWLDSNESIVSESSLVAPGETQQQADQRAVSDMDQSKIDAAIVVLSKVDRYPRSHGRDVLVEGYATSRTTGLPDPACPAYGRLFPGDVIRSVHGTETPSVEAFRRVLDALPAPEPITIRGTAGGAAFRVTLTRRRCAGSPRPLIGIVTEPTFPFPVTISSGDIGGPSAGLMWALGLYDLLTPGDLTGGRTVAGTGVILPDGRIFPIGGVEKKVAAAKASGARVFLVPAGENHDDAKKVAGDLTLVPVRTFDDALRYLLAHGGSDAER